MPCVSEISRIRTGGSSGLTRARASTARQAYSDFAEIFMNTSHGSQGGRSTPRNPAVCTRSKLATVQRVEAAFGLGLTGPASRPFVVTGRDSLRARPAADRGEALVV